MIDKILITNMSSTVHAYTYRVICSVMSKSKIMGPNCRPSSKVVHSFKSLTTARLLSSTSSSSSHTRGLVLGVYEPLEKDAAFILTPAAKKFDESIGGRLASLLQIAGRKLKSGKSRVLFDLDKTYTSVAVCNLGKQDAGFNENEGWDEAKENVRTAIAAGVLALRDVGETSVDVDPCDDAEASAEGSVLPLFAYNEFKAKEKKIPSLDLTCYSGDISSLSLSSEKWRRGLIMAGAQNFARRLKETPANKMTPTIFSNEVVSKFSDLKAVNITVRDQSWAEQMKMGSFLSVAQGSEEAPKFLEIDYLGGQSDDAPVALVGKGVTFDTGGISIKPSADMDKMRADMGGAACVVGTIEAAARLEIPINVKGFIPLCENMPSGIAVKPGDVVTAMNGKTIQVDNTDAEGRLILADALCYAETFNPKLIVDVATLTGAIAVALGAGVTGVYTKSQLLWDLLEKAGGVTGDRVWRMPLLKYYTSHVTKSDLADVNNIGTKGRYAGSCTAAAFLKEFVKTDKWMHLDIAGVMMNKGDVPYLSSGMSGRPTRTLIQFLENISKMSLE